MLKTEIVVLLGPSPVNLECPTLARARSLPCLFPAKRGSWKMVSWNPARLTCFSPNFILTGVLKIDILIRKYSKYTSKVNRWYHRDLERIVLKSTKTWDEIQHSPSHRSRVTGPKLLENMRTWNDHEVNRLVHEMWRRKLPKAPHWKKISNNWGSFLQVGCQPSISEWSQPWF